MASVASKVTILYLILSLVILSSVPSANGQGGRIECIKICAKWVFENVIVPVCIDYALQCLSPSPSPPAISPPKSPPSPTPGQPPSSPSPGGPNSPTGSGSGDPHFVGAHGTRYNFNGLPGMDYCLFTDSSVQMNMHMIGHIVNNGKGGKAVRTWIGKLGIMWKAGGKSHSLVLSARDGPQLERGSGFLAGAELDHVALSALQVGETRALPGGADFTFNHIAPWGPEKKNLSDVYFIKLPGLVTIRVQLRVETHPSLRTSTNAWTHVDVALRQVHPTGKVHGVLGQTFRKDRGSRAMKFSALGSLLRRSVAADGHSGAGFLDGSTADYETSSVSAADCRFSAFNEAE